MPKPFIVRAIWDGEAKVFVATSEDVPGLATEAPTIEALLEKLRVMIPELLEANGLLPTSGKPEWPEVPISLLAKYNERIRIDA